MKKINLSKKQELIIGTLMFAFLTFCFALIVVAIHNYLQSGYVGVAFICGVIWGQSLIGFAKGVKETVSL